MKKMVLLLVLAGLAYARPSCDSFPYHDFVWESSYNSPLKPLDTFLDNCGQIRVDISICGELTNPNLTIKERRQLILDGLVKNSSAPDFNTAEEWNNNIKFTKYAPDGIPYHNSSNIRDAWLKIVSINPSLYAGNTLLINGSGKVQAVFNFSFVVKKESFPQDCNTEYEICGYTYTLGTQLDNTSAKASLGINTQYLIHHYELVTVCTSDGDFCYTVCEYAYSDNIRDSLTLNDKTTVNQYTPAYSAFTFIEKYGNGLVGGWLVFNATGSFNNARFSIGNSYIVFRNSSYELSANFSPYNAITPKIIVPPVDFGFYGLSILEYETNGSLTTIHFLAPANQLNCSFDFYGHFSHIHRDNFCILGQDEPIINLTLLNRTNETVSIGLKFYDNTTNEALADKTVMLSYGNQSTNITTDADGESNQSFVYSPDFGLVSAEFRTDFQTKSAKGQLVVPSDFPISLQTAIYIVSLIFALYLFYEFSKRWSNEK